MPIQRHSFRLTKAALNSFVLTFIGFVALFNTGWWAALETSANSQQSSSPTPTPKPISAAELAKLRWIEGAWRGTGDGQSPFFERYHFENDTTLVVESFADETLNKVTDVSRYELKDGQFSNQGEGARWRATQITDDVASFEPVAKARNSFRWQRESKDVWKAVLEWPATGSRPAGQRVYRLERWPLVKR